MQHQLSAIVDAFEAARTRVRRLGKVTSEQRWATRSDPRRWSVAECIAHLNLTSHAYIPLLHNAFAQHPPRDPPPQRYRRDFVGWLIGIAAGPLPHIGRVRFGRAQTAPAFVPGGDLDRERTLGEF